LKLEPDLDPEPEKLSEHGASWYTNIDVTTVSKIITFHGIQIFQDFVVWPKRTSLIVKNIESFAYYNCLWWNPHMFVSKNVFLRKKHEMLRPQIKW